MPRHGAREGRSSRLRQWRRSRSDSSSSDGERSDASDHAGLRSRSRRHGDRADDAGLSFEHIEAIRGVKIIPRVEYPLPHLPREKLLKHDDANAECLCTFPTESDEDKNRCEDVSCLNYATYIECSPAHCDAGKYCCNQRLQHPERFPELEPFKTDNKGFGVRAREEIAQSTVIGEYVGEIIDEKELQRRLQTVPRHELNFYYLALQPGVYIDARNKGSFTRFMNHSCEPNCKTEKWTVKGETRIAVVSMRNISPQEELTFDYQWKSLGSQQIKCHCGAATCRGVIGAEVDATKTIVDTGSVQGFYREPTREEIGDVLVGRHIRLFLSASDTSIYAIATVRGFNADEDTYEVEYVESVGTPEDSSSFDSPLSAIEELRNQPFVKLSERSWQIYVELGGMSNDQIEKAVFSIPKRRAAESSTASDSPGKADSQATATTASASPYSTTPSPTPIPAPPVYMEYRDHDGELLDVDGEIVTTKLLIKGLPPKCTEPLLRRVFSAPRQSQSASMLQRLQSSIIAQRSTTDSVLLKLDLFFFDDSSGWALVEFTDPSFAKLFRKNLNARDLLGQQLRVFLAGKKEVEGFERAKRNAALRRADTNDRDVKAGMGHETASSAVAPRQLPPVVYPFGRALDWLVNVEKVEDSPSRRKGMSQASEERMRALYVQLIVQVTSRLRLESEFTSSAVLSLHRMFTFRPMTNLDIEIMAAGMLHICLKSRSRRFSWPDYVVEVYSAKYPSGTKLQVDSEVYKRFERQILETEMELLDSVLYDLSYDDPYAILESITSSRKKSDAVNSVQFPTPIRKQAKHLIKVVFQLTVWAHASVECVTLSILYVAAAVSTALTFSGVDVEFTPCDIPAYLPFLDPYMSEKDALALLECSMLIADGLKERWVREEKQLLAKRLAARHADPDFFDTEQFAVQRHKPVEISIRIATLLKAWIGVSGSPIRHQYGTRAPLKSLNELKTRRILGSLNEQFAVALPDRSNVKVNDILQRMPVPAKSGVDLYRRARRLRVKDLESVQQIRKRSYLASITSSLDGLYDVVGKPVYVQPWPYQQLEPVFRKSNGAVSRACVRELSTAMLTTARAPHRFLNLVGVVYPDEEKENAEDPSSTPDFRLDLQDHSPQSKLESSDYYLAFEQPLHSYAGLLEAKTNVPVALRKKAIFDMLQAIAMCHEWNLVHRYVAPCHLFVMRDGIRLGGYQAVREMSVKSETSGRQYELNDIERKEHCHGTWLQVSPPEVLLGGRHFTTRGDIWAAGCVALDILFDRIPFLHAPDVKAQLNLIYRLCGTPLTMWKDGAKLSHYGMFKPKRETNMRVRKTLLENRQEKRLDVPDAAIDVLEAMLHLDPSKRMSAKRLLEMPFFAECRQNTIPLDFSQFPPTFETQSRRFQSGASSSSSSKRRRDHERPSSASSAESAGGKSRRESSSRRSSGVSSVSDDAEMDAEMDASNLVPLPDMLRVKDEGEDAQEEKPVVTQKRAKLDWGMGLSTHG